MTIFYTQICLQYFTAESYSTDISSIRQDHCAADNCEVDYCTNTKKVLLQHVCESIAAGGIMPTVWLFRVYKCHISEALGYSDYVQLSG